MKKNFLKSLFLSLLMVLGVTNAWADELTATLDHTAGAQWGSNTGASTVDAEKEHYNNDAASGWSGCAFAQFSAEIPSGASITEAKLTYYVNQGGRASRDDIIYYMKAGFAIDYGTFAGQTGTDLRYAGDRAGKAVAKATTGGTGDRGPLTFDVTDAVKAILGDGQNYIIFQWTGNAGGADLYGKGAGAKAPVLTITTADASTQTTYTVRFLDHDEATLKDDAVYQGTIGDVVAPSADDKADFRTADGSKKYLFDEATPRTITLAADAASNLFKLYFVEAERISYTLKSNLGTTLASGSDFEGETVTAYYPHYQLVDGTLYECPKQGTNPWYGVSIDLSATNTATIDYTATDVANVVFAAEGEAIEGATYSNTNYADIRSFGGAVGFAESDLVVTTLAPGKYILKADLFTPTSAMGSTTFRVGEAEYKLTSTANGYHNELTTDEFTVEQATDVVWVAGGAKTNAVDWLYIQKTGDVEVASTWRDIKADFTNGAFFTADDSAVTTAGLKMNEDGTFTRVAADAADANAVITGKYHSNEHGLQNFSAVVPVQGPVKITLGTCAWGGNVTVKNGEGVEVVPAFSTNTGACYHQNKEANIVSAYYKGNAATLTIAGGSYVPYFAVEAVDPADIPNDAKVTFTLGEAEGVAPAELTVEVGNAVTIPANTSLWVEGKTLTAWTDGTTQYAVGSELTVSKDVTLTPVFVANAVSFNDRTAEVTALWDFQQKNGAVAQGIEGQTGFVVTQVSVNGQQIDFRLDIDATSGKYNNRSWTDWAQVNGGTKLTLPVCKGAVVSTYSMGDNSETTFAGDKGTYENNVNTYTYEGSGSTLDIIIQGGSYYRWVQAVYPVVAAEGGFTDIKADFTNGSFFTAEETTVATAGLKMNEDGTFTRVAADAADANAVITGKYHSNEHGLQNFSAVVPVEGTVKITFGTCAWGGDVTVKNAEGQTVATFNTNTGACYHQNKEANVISAFYKQDVATTLTISGGSYVPYFAVEKVDPKDVPSDVKFNFAAGSEATGVAPASESVAIGKDYTLPKNFTLYVEGKTLTGWTDGTTTYAPGQTITAPDAEVIDLTAVFTANEVNLADREEPVTLKFDFQRQNGAPTVAWQNQDGLVWVTQATIGGKTIDVPAFASTNPGKIANGNWTDWCQMNGGTTFTIPSCKGAVVSIESYSATTTTTIDGQTDYTASGNVVTYEIGGTAETIDIVIGDGSYFRYIQTVLPVVEKQGGKSFDNEAANIVWALNSVDEYATPDTAEPAGAFTLCTVGVGDFTTTVDAPSAGANSGVKMLKLQPTGGDNTNVEFIAKPYKGLTFTPTKVSGKVARFGTDGGTLNVSAKNAEGEEVVLATGLIPARNNKDQSDDAKGSDPNYTTEFSFDVPASLATAESFSLVVTESGLATNKQWGIGDVHIVGTVNGTSEEVAQYTIAAVANPEEGGTVNVYPQGGKFDEGTELTLTATEKFGYDFVNWTDDKGTEVSAEPKFKYTLQADAVLTANFQKVNTYELALTVDGTNDYMVTISPAPTVVDGKNMYEEGTAVQLSANQYEGLVTFTNWSDGETNSSKIISMSEDVTLTAFYAEADIIAGWDFYRAGASGRKADFAAEDNDADVLNLVNTETGEVQGWLDKSTVGGGGYESFAGAAVNWRTGSKNGDVGNWHWQTKVNAAAFTDINVQFQMLYNYNAYQRYDAEYSLDGENWTKFGDITMTGAKAAAQFSEALPAAANNQADLYIRMKADKTSNVDGSGSANDGNTLAMFFITGTPKLVNDGVAPVLVSSVPANGATGASATGKIVLTFDERVKVADGAKATLGGAELTPAVSGKTVTFEYKGLEYSTEYTFSLPANTVADLTDNYLAQPISISFTTMVRPTVTKKLYDFIVPDNGSFKEALLAAAARADQSQRYRIFVKKGNYIIPANQDVKVDGNDGKQYADPKTSFGAANVSIIGEDREATTVTNELPNSLSDNPDAGKGGVANPLEGIRTSGVLYLTNRAENTYFQDIKLWSATADGTGRNVVLVDGGNKTVCKNVNLWAYQDTYVSDNTRSLYYFEGGLLRGRTDFLCGSGDVFYNGVTLQMCEEGGYIAVPRDNVKYGYVFKDCTIKGETAKVDGNYYLGRPWTKGAEVYYIDTKMEAVPKGEGWANMSSDGCTRMAEWNSMTATGSVIDLSARTKVLGGNPNNPVLTAEEALEIGNLHNMFGDWDPTLLTEQAPAPTNVQLAGNTLTWTGSNYALLYAVVKNGNVVDFTTEPTYTVDDASATWAVRAANEMGGLGEAVAAGATDGIGAIETTADQDGAIYNLQGVRVSKAVKGLYIVNGKKVVVK